MGFKGAPGKGCRLRAGASSREWGWRSRRLLPRLNFYLVPRSEPVVSSLQAGVPWSASWYSHPCELHPRRVGLNCVNTRTPGTCHCATSSPGHTNHHRFHSVPALEEASCHVTRTSSSQGGTEASRQEPPWTWMVQPSLAFRRGSPPDLMTGIS